MEEEEAALRKQVRRTLCIAQFLTVFYINLCDHEVGTLTAYKDIYIRLVGLPRYSLFASRWTAF